MAAEKLFILIGAAQNWTEYKQYAPSEQPENADILLIDPGANPSIEKDLKKLNRKNRMMAEYFDKTLINTAGYMSIFVICYTADIPYDALKDPRWTVIYCGHCSNASPLNVFDVDLSPRDIETIDRLNVIREHTVGLHNHLSDNSKIPEMIETYMGLIRNLKSMACARPHLAVVELYNGLLDREGGLLLNVGTSLFWANRHLNWKFTDICKGKYRVREF